MKNETTTPNPLSATMTEKEWSDASRAAGILMDAQPAKAPEPPAQPKSGIKGIYFIASTGKWQANIWVDGKRIVCGTRPTIPKAEQLQIDTMQKLLTKT